MFKFEVEVEVRGARNVVHVVRCAWSALDATIRHMAKQNLRVVKVVLPDSRYREGGRVLYQNDHWV